MTELPCGCCRLGRVQRNPTGLNCRSPFRAKKVNLTTEGKEALRCTEVKYLMWEMALATNGLTPVIVLTTVDAKLAGACNL